MHFQSENDANSWLDSYDCYLRDVAGVAAATRTRYWRVVRRFVAACFDDTAQWATPSVQQIIGFICEETASKKGCGRGVPVTAVRSFLRFLGGEAIGLSSFAAFSIIWLRSFREQKCRARASSPQVDGGGRMCSPMTR